MIYRRVSGIVPYNRKRQMLVKASAAFVNTEGLYFQTSDCPKDVLTKKIKANKIITTLI